RPRCFCCSWFGPPDVEEDGRLPGIMGPGRAADKRKQYSTPRECGRRRRGNLRARTLNTQQWLPPPLPQAFDFFTDAPNPHHPALPPPPGLRCRLAPPRRFVMPRGTALDSRLRWRGAPLAWRTEISAWQPPYRFIDRQVRGPYRLWLHEHTFEERDGGTLM